MQSRENLIEEKILSDKPKKGRSKKKVLFMWILS